MKNLSIITLIVALLILFFVIVHLVTFPYRVNTVLTKYFDSNFDEVIIETYEE